MSLITGVFDGLILIFIAKLVNCFVAIFCDSCALQGVQTQRLGNLDKLNIEQGFGYVAKILREVTWVIHL